MANDRGSAFCDVQSTLLASKPSLQAAAKEGHLEVVEKLLEAKADVNAATWWDGRTALQAAAEGGHLEVVEKLLEAKADVNASTRLDGRTALQAAAEGGHLEVVEKLLEAKADVNAATWWEGRTALQAAAEGGHLEVVEKLLEAKADVLEVVEKLLGAMADINAAAASWGGRTAQRKSPRRKLVARFSQDEEGLSRSAVAQSEAALQEARDQLQPEEDVSFTMKDRLIQPQDAILGINRGLVSTQIMQALTPTVEGINSNGDDLPAVQFLHAKRPKKKRGLPGFVNGVRVAAMADTGASVNVISEAYAQKMRLEIVESDASYRLGNSRSGRCIGKLCTAQAYRSYESR